jgi:hypothetical protein
MDEDNTPGSQDLGDLEGGDPPRFDVFENGAGDDAIDNTLGNHAATLIAPHFL